MKLLLLTILICAPVLLAAQPSWARKWSDAKGKYSIEAELVEVKADKVVLRKAGGSEITVQLERLSQVDRRHLESLGHPAPSATELAADKQIGELLKGVLQQSDVPAIAGAIVTSEGLAAFGVTGVRKRGTKAPAMPNDLWHLGSNTKAMTATLIARLIEQDQLKWDTTLADVFPDSSFKIHPDLRGVTVLHLLSHRSGLPANLNLAEYLGANGRRERLRAVRQELAKQPANVPGSKYEYSNLGYIIAGAIVERLTGKSWEKNMVEHVFGPLEMKSVGFGGTGTPGKVDQPWPHAADGQPVPINGPTIDNPPVMGPAGRVHCTIQDYSKYVADILGGMTGKPALLPSGAYKKLSTPPFGGQYALGWIVTEREWAGGTVLTHNGSNTENYATVWIAPQRDFAILACTNQGGDAAQAACDAAVTALIEHHAATAGEIAAPARGAVDASVPPRSEPVEDADYEKKSPFTAVRWQKTQPEVQVNDQWFKLVSLNELPVAEIVSFSRRTYANQWRKRFEEDLVELLSRMGHPPQDTVKLVVRPPTSSEAQVLEDVPMTEANRQAIKAAAEKTEPSSASPIVRAAPEVLKKYEGVYEITPQFAMTVTVEDGQLVVQATGQGKLQFLPESPRKFICKAVDARITFMKGADGKVNRLILHQNGANQVAKRRKAVEGDPAVPESFVGVYEITPQFAMTVTVEDGKLMVQATGQGKLPLEPESATKFSCRGVDAQITFVRNDNGKFSRLVLHQNGANQLANRREKVEGGAEEKLESFVGVYAITPQFEMTVTEEGGKLFVQATGQGKLPLERESATKFSCKLVNAEVSFEKDDDGKFSQLVLHQNGANQVAMRRD